MLRSPAERRAVDTAFWSIVDQPGGCPPHIWGCPKVMKVDPEHVAWTCERCGAISISDDLQLKPTT